MSILLDKNALQQLLQNVFINNISLWNYRLARRTRALWCQERLYVICQNFAFVISLCVSKLCCVFQHVEFLHRMYMLKKKANLNLASLREYEMEANVISKWSHFLLIINKDIKFALNV